MDLRTRSMPPPSLGVVIPCYNAERWVASAIQSVLDQSYPNLSLVVVDDGSTDGSLDVVASFENSLTLIKGKNRGACAARNTGMRACDCDFVIFLDADDYLHGEFMEALASHISDDVDLVIGSHVKIDQEGAFLDRRDFLGVEGVQDALLRYLLTPVQTGAFLWRRSRLVAAGGWDESLPIWQDVELVFRMLLHNTPFVVAETTEARVVWRAHRGARISTQITAPKMEAMLRVLNQIEPGLSAFDDSELSHGLALSYYRFARLAFMQDRPELGRQALRTARLLGLEGHPGSMAHRLGSSLMGLEWKTRLTRGFGSATAAP